MSATLPSSLPMLRQIRLDFLLIEGTNRGLLRLRPDVGVVLEHLIAHVPGKSANCLFRNVRSPRETRYEGMSQIVPTITHASSFASLKPCFAPRTCRAGQIDVVPRVRASLSRVGYFGLNCLWTIS